MSPSLRWQLMTSPVPERRLDSSTASPGFLIDNNNNHSNNQAPSDMDFPWIRLLFNARALFS